jgi:hypothetical protein
VDCATDTSAATPTAISGSAVLGTGPTSIANAQSGASIVPTLTKEVRDEPVISGTGRPTGWTARSNGGNGDYTRLTVLCAP